MENENTAKKVMLSGIQPSGDLHLGNYLGAGLAIKAGSKITRPIILFVLVLLLLKVLGVF